MVRMRRRWALALLAGGASAAAINAEYFSGRTPAPRPSDVSVRQPPPTLAEENLLPGEPWWPKEGLPTTDDDHRQIQGYVNKTSILPGDSLDFHVAVNPAGRYRITIHRLGWYGGAGARTVYTSPELEGVPQEVPAADAADGMIACRWPRSWGLDVPTDWPSGVYQAVFTSVAGWRACTPFIVRDDQRRSDLCVVLPVTTWQAYNQWPKDRRQGKSLYNGYSADGRTDPELRAARVSFDRPYANEGIPSRFLEDQHAIQFLERSGYDISYATSFDLHSGRLDPTRHRGIVFCGHDEYWSTEMRGAAERAVAGGTSVAYFGANSIYWRILVDAADDGRPERTITCTKIAPTDLSAVTDETTSRWRDRGEPEQAFLGVQYNGVVDGRKSLVVRAADHWFWAGTGVAEGDRIPSLVGGEADGRSRGVKPLRDVRATILSASPYRTSQGRPQIQSSHIYETANGAIVFAAGTLRWTTALNSPTWRNERIERATRNLLDRIVERTVPPAQPTTPATPATSPATPAVGTV
ncbi:N,N-dimethylformamidase beta subunit family domain-containing protein [Micromonospora sp. NPDC050495]|uniref:N,N-dimethylformamidase beta subunit family domain-containing protein n=1 Tax=Micromonospora sp. NPDC050495 TaxID=3154936 RepID=UPI0033CD9B0F